MFSSRNQFDKLFDKAITISSESDWTTVVKICDMIRQGDIQPKYVLTQIKKKSTHTNPHTALFALEVLELCVKNCGCLVHDEISTQAYMEQLTGVVKTTKHVEVKHKILQLLQAWAFVFRNTEKYRIILDTVTAMKTEGYTFPKLKERDAIFSTEIAPDWTTGVNCTQCGAQFGVILRRHHCRACGKVFCGQCSSKTCPLPRFGIEKEVRVCDHCHLIQKYNREPSCGEMSIEYACSPSDLLNENPLNFTENEKLAEEQALQMSLALSQFEAEIKKNKDATPNKYVKEEGMSESGPGEASSLSQSEDNSLYTHQCQSCGQEFYNQFLADKCSHYSQFQTGKVVKLCDKCKEKHCTPLFSRPSPSVNKLEGFSIELPPPRHQQIQECSPSQSDEETTDRGQLLSDRGQLLSDRGQLLSDRGQLLSDSYQSPPLSPPESVSNRPPLTLTNVPNDSNEPTSSQDLECFGEKVELAEEAKPYYESETRDSSLNSKDASELTSSTQGNNITGEEKDHFSQCSSTERFQLLKDDHDCTNRNEFTVFGQQVAVQLSKLSVKRALELQQEILRMLTQARIDELSWLPNDLSLIDTTSLSSGTSRDDVDSKCGEESTAEQLNLTQALESSA